jgi:deoxycytidylate deaminase
MSKIGQAVLEEQERQEPYEEYVRRRLGMYDEPYSKWHMRFMDMAKMVSTWSKDPSSQIGAVAIDDQFRILATGYNGFPKGIADTEERLNDKDQKYPRIIHA